MVGRAALALSLGFVAAFLAAGCGGGGKAPSVASLTTTHGASTTESPSAAPSGVPHGGGEIGISVGVKGGEKFAACVRSHGVPNFPDPNAQGAIQFGSGSGIDPRSPKVHAALQACRKLLPNGGQPTPQQLAKGQQQALKFSACMRSHGLKDFPDPTVSGGGIQLKIKGGAGSDLNPSSSLFQKAQKACQGDMPGKALGPGGPSGK